MECRPTQASVCSSFDDDCPVKRGRCHTDDLGATRRWVRIDSTPTPAAIYLDGSFIGYTPMRHAMSFTSKTRRLRLVAVPLYAGQAEQQRLIVVPPLPDRVAFFMNNGNDGANRADTVTEGQTEAPAVDD